MAYQGEDIPFIVKGDENLSLEANDFKVLTYPCGKPDSAYTLEKSQFSKDGENMYSGKIPYTETKTMEPGNYTIEVLLIVDGTTRTVYMNKMAFPLYPAAARNVE